MCLNHASIFTALQGKGWCFRLYTEADFNNLPMSTIPEIQRCSLTSSMLQLKCLGQDMETLDFMDKPDIEASKPFLQFTSSAKLNSCYVP